MSEAAAYPYETHVDIRFQPLETIDVQALADSVTHPWWNQTLTRVNDAVVRLGVIRGEYHWHKHDDEDEFFYVVEGRLLVDLDGRTVELGPRQGITVPRGLVHRTRAPERTIILMVEGAGVVPTGDATGEREMSPHGAALLAHYRGEEERPLLIRRDDGLEAELPMALCFRPPAEFSAIERLALDLCRGRVLDVGAGSGLHALALQERGIAVTAIDLDPQAIEVMRGRGVVDARRANLWALGGESFDTVFMLGHGIGLAGDMAGLARLLAHARGLVAEGGQLLFDSSDPALTDDPRHLAYHEANRRAGRYIGETRICLVHDGVPGPTFGWLLVDPETLAREAEAAGWRCEVVQREETGEYLARLTR